MAEEKDKLTDSLKDMTEQFKEMHESLDKLAESQKPVTKAAKLDIDHHHKLTAAKKPVPTPKVELGKQTRKEILEALRNIRSQIVVSQQREHTASDVAAEHLAAGGGLIGAASAAAGFQAKRLKGAFKRKFDPLNIINRLTGGSKLATVLAGKVMGRSEKSIRGAAGLAGGLQMEPQSFGAPTPFAPQNEAPTPVESGRAITLLEKMAGSLMRIEASQDESLQLTKKQTDHLEELKDSSAEEKAEFHKKELPTQITKTGIEKEGKTGGWMDQLMGWFKGMGVAALALVAAGALLYSQWGKLKLSFSLLGDSIQDLWQSIKDGLSSIKKWVVDTMNAIRDSILDAGESMIEGVKSILPGYTPPTEAEKHEELKKTAAGGGFGAARAQRKLAAEAATAMATQGDSDTILKKLAPNFAGKLAGKDLPSTTAEDLRKGTYIDPAIKALKGEQTVSGSPSRVTTAGALTQMVGQAYGELYKDETGKPLSPSKDTSPNKDARLQALTQQASNYLADAIVPTPAGAPTPITVPTIAPAAPTAGLTPAATAPMELPAPAPMTGQLLNESADLQRSATMEPKTTPNNNSIVNVKNNNVSSTTIQQRMASPRSSESSFLRSNDRGFAPA